MLWDVLAGELDTRHGLGNFGEGGCWWGGLGSELELGEGSEGLAYKRAHCNFEVW